MNDFNIHYTQIVNEYTWNTFERQAQRKCHQLTRAHMSSHDQIKYIPVHMSTSSIVHSPLSSRPRAKAPTRITPFSSPKDRGQMHSLAYTPLGLTLPPSSPLPPYYHKLIREKVLRQVSWGEGGGGGHYMVCLQYHIPPSGLHGDCLKVKHDVTRKIH